MNLGFHCNKIPNKSFSFSDAMNCCFYSRIVSHSRVARFGELLNLASMFLEPQWFDCSSVELLYMGSLRIWSLDIKDASLNVERTKNALVTTPVKLDKV